MHRIFQAARHTAWRHIIAQWHLSATVEGWLKLHNFKSRKVRRLGKDKESGLQLVEVILSPMVNASIKDVLTPYREAYKWREMADVQPISYYRQEVML